MGNDMKFDTILVRYGEIGTKSKTVRSRFERRLVENISERLNASDVPFSSIEARDSRVLVYTSDEKALESLSKVFGIVSFSPATRVECDLDTIASKCVEIACSSNAKTFAIRTQRVFKKFPYTSMDINRIVGQRVVDELGLRVDLENPELEIGIEILSDACYVFMQRIDGLGGLPVSVSGKVVVLLSAGIDSPVAAWLMMKRGCSIIAVHFKQSESEYSKFMEICDVLQEYAYASKIERIVVSYEKRILPVLEKLWNVSRKARKWTCIVCKMMMYRIAEKIARTHNAHAIVTGDSLAQVASQTLENLDAESRAVKINILRPLIGFDKDEIVKLAKKIGTYRISVKKPYTCPYAPKYPETHASLEELSKILEKADLNLLA